MEKKNRKIEKKKNRNLPGCWLAGEKKTERKSFELNSYGAESKILRLAARLGIGGIGGSHRRDRRIWERREFGNERRELGNEEN
jgi:hypothetical protein